MQTYELKIDRLLKCQTKNNVKSKKQLKKKK